MADVNVSLGQMEGRAVWNNNKSFDDMTFIVEVAGCYFPEDGTTSVAE